MIPKKGQLFKWKGANTYLLALEDFVTDPMNKGMIIGKYMFEDKVWNATLRERYIEVIKR